MAQNTIKTRIQLKYDTEQNWNKATNFVPLRGEVIIYSPDDTRRFCRIKVGDGSTPVVDLPFIPYSDGGGGANVETHTTEYWQAHSSYIPAAGEIIVYSDRNNNIPGIKIGDGLTYVVDLPFIDDTIMTHINDATIHVSAEDRAFWDNKINCEDTVENEVLQLNRR